jgi:hypothetical protein
MYIYAEQNKMMATEKISEESILQFIMLMDERVTFLLSSFISWIWQENVIWPIILWTQNYFYV